ncbi:CoA-binding protein [Sulfurospirillum sp. T05]|uniref:CoA-binding protein n=1 Tax=Sulfurospirillum tamanense TaxID=2813362 RepID=A0ABS2WSI6_9BACT|nr:CoA-binding protein [Sulfurospirillum tamanensis]
MPILHEPTTQTLRELFASIQTIAIVGLSPDTSKPSHRVAAYLQKEGFRIIPIYPKEEVILGEKVYRSLTEVDIPIDMVDMFRKPEVADALVEQIKDRKEVKCLWLQLGISNDSAAQKASQMGLTVVQDRCTKIEHQRIFHP